MLQQKFVDLFARGSNVALPVAERDVVLTYVLRILVDAGLLDRLVFKGGTCVRKVFLGRGAFRRILTSPLRRFLILRT